MKELTPEILNMIDNTLWELTKKIHQHTGKPVIIGWGAIHHEKKEEKDISFEGACGSRGLTFTDAGKLLLGINGYVADCFGEDGNLLKKEYHEEPI